MRKKNIRGYVMSPLLLHTNTIQMLLTNHVQPHLRMHPRYDQPVRDQDVQEVLPRERGDDRLPQVQVIKSVR